MRAIFSCITLVFALCVVSTQTASAEPATCHGQVVTIVGTSGPDVLVGTSGPDVIAGLGGNDDIRALGGDDIVCGGGGNDEIDGGLGNDWIAGQAGDDTILGDKGECLVEVNPLNRFSHDYEPSCDPGPGGNDHVFGGSGHDLLAGDEGSDRLFGGPGDDEILAGSGLAAGIDTDTMRGGDGNDAIHGGADRDRGYGEDGDDSFKPYGAADILDRFVGGSGSDDLSTNLNGNTEGVVKFFGGADDDKGLTYSYGMTVYFFGQDGNDFFGDEFESADTYVFGGPGDDELYAPILLRKPNGESYGAWVYGGPGSDELGAISPNSWLYGGPGDDGLFGTGEKYGGEGNDQISTYRGTARGGPGDDALRSFGTAPLVMRGGPGNDQIFAHRGFARISGGDDTDGCGGLFVSRSTCETEQISDPVTWDFNGGVWD